MVHTRKELAMIKKIISTFSEIAFPKVCVCCGNSVVPPNEYICNYCLRNRFAPHIPDETLILPEIINFQFAMWQFDKGGYLQNLLHKLKYDYLKGVGEELGFAAGKAFLKYNEINNFNIGELTPLIVPVPLHPSKQRKRGYNQARAIGEGISKVMGWPVLASGEVERIKKTTTQTGLSSEARKKNLFQAFKLNDREIINQHFPIVVDDVFTTGATTFELADELLKENREQRAGILTVAMA